MTSVAKVTAAVPAAMTPVAKVTAAVAAMSAPSMSTMAVLREQLSGDCREVQKAQNEGAELRCPQKHDQAPLRKRFQARFHAVETILATAGTDIMALIHYTDSRPRRVSARTKKALQSLLTGPDGA